MFSLSDLRVSINDLGFIPVSKLSFDISSSPTVHQNINGESLAYSFKDGMSGSLKLTIDTDILQQFFKKMWGVELVFAIESVLSEDSTSWLSSIIQSKPRESSEFSKYEFRCFMSSFNESVESKVGVRESQVQFEVLGLKIDGNDFLWNHESENNAAQIKADSNQIQIDNEALMDGVLLEISYRNTLIHEKKEIESSNVGYRIIKGFDEAKIKLKALIFNTKDKKKEDILREFYDFFFQQEYDKNGELRPKVRFVKHAMLFHKYYIFDEIGYSQSKDYIQVDFSAIEYQAIERDKASTYDLKGVPVSEPVEAKNVSPSGNVIKKEKGLVFAQELAKNKGDFTKTSKSFIF